MGYIGNYSILARCISELFATLIYVFLLQCLLANGLLPQTKAAHICYAWVAFGVGMAVFVPVQLLGFISAFLSPATALASAVSQQIDWMDYPLLVISQLLGAFLASILTWLYYLPLFETYPQPKTAFSDDPLLQRNEAISSGGLDFISYNTKPEALIAPTGAGFMEFGRLMSLTTSKEPDAFRSVHSLSMPKDRYTEHNPQILRQCRTVDLTEKRIHSLHRRESTLHVIDESANDVLERSASIGDTVPQINQDSRNSSFNLGRNLSPTSARAHSMTSTPFSSLEISLRLKSRRSQEMARSSLQKSMKEEEMDAEEQRLEEKIDPKLMASHIADQNLKLSLFCTRPAKYFPLSNLLTEIMSVFLMAFALLLIEEKATLLNDGYRSLYRHGLVAFLEGFLIFIIALSLGGMGVGMNLAREIASRFAHFILPIQGKGFSEWYYVWIPTIGPLIGGALAGAGFNLVKHLDTYEQYGILDDDQFNILRSGVSELIQSCSNRTRP